MSDDPKDVEEIDVAACCLDKKRAYSYRKLGSTEWHLPFITEVVTHCPWCGSELSTVETVRKYMRYAVLGAR